MINTTLLRDQVRIGALLAQPDIPPAQAANLLAPVGFKDWQAALAGLQRLAAISPGARAALVGSLSSLLIALSETAAPNQVLVNFERFIQRAENPAAMLVLLADNPRSYEILATLFAGSQFLTGILQRDPPTVEQVVDLNRLPASRTREAILADAKDAIFPFVRPRATEETPDSDQMTPAMDALRHFQHKELLRVGACDLLGLIDLPSVTRQLSHLADSLAQAALLMAAYHSDIPVEPQAGTADQPGGFVVLAMGKLGGEELNYSSDIDLIFLAHEQPNKYIKMGQKLIDILARNTTEGFLYRVDMRLRPWGRSGALVSTVDSYLGYLEKNAGLWERQALLKARPIAGKITLGESFLEAATALIFDNPGSVLRAEIHRLKQQIESRLRQRGREWGEVKLGQGSIRDIEFVTQYLQLANGPRFAARNTLQALEKLTAANILSAAESRVLIDGYVFLRTVEHHLQLMHYQQTHSLPKDAAALDSLARRLGFQGQNIEVGRRFTEQYQQHTAVIRTVYQRYLARDPESGQPIDQQPPDVLPLLVRMHPSYVTTFSRADIERHALLILKLDRNDPVQIQASPLEGGLWRLTIVGYDLIGVLSLICGLLVVHNLDIVEGHVFSYGPSIEAEDVESADAASGSPPRRAWRRRTVTRPAAGSKLPERKIVDVFTVRPLSAPGPQTADTGETPVPLNADFWDRYAADLARLFSLLQQDDHRAAQGELAKRVGLAVPHSRENLPALLPVGIEIDNDSSERHTVLRIDALDTFGFLYEFTNALALNGVNVRHMTVASAGSQVRDILHVTDARKNKITDPAKQRELRAATVLIKHFTHLLPRSPNPEAALGHFREFVARLFTQPNWPDQLTSLEEPEVLTNLARLLGVSDFLWYDFLRMQYGNLLPVVSDVSVLEQTRSRAQLREELAVLLHTTPRGQAQITALNDFKDREMFRVDMRQIQGHITRFGHFSAELTDLAEVVVEAATQLAIRDLRTQYGIPRLRNGSECPFCVCALGKCGGRELGYASDIELMYIFEGNGHTTGPRVVTNAEYFTKLVQEVNQTIQTKREGVFELDLRLRPYGSAGSMSVSRDSFESYFGPDGDAWPYERQALVKLRPVAGDLNFGQQVVRLRDKLIYTGKPFDVAAMRAMRERQLRHLVKAGTMHAKFSPGALVDAEYLVQGLQITYGHLDSSLRQPNTRATMQALAAIKIIPPEDYPRLLEALNFLRNLINALRIVRGNAKDLTVPSRDEESFSFLARRLNYGDDLIRLQNDLNRHADTILKLNRRLLDRISRGQ
jgi:glutamate-ammonia-ligase adenylyltransferase